MSFAAGALSNSFLMELVKSLENSSSAIGIFALGGH